MIDNYEYEKILCAVGRLSAASQAVSNQQYTTAGGMVNRARMDLAGLLIAATKKEDAK